MARVNVDQKALTDPRFHVLAVSLGCPPPFAQAAGLGLCLRIWNECQERESYTLETDLIDAILGAPGSWKKLVDAKLSRIRKNGSCYICGSKERTAWLAKLREANRLRQKRYRERNAVTNAVTNAFVTPLSRGAPAPAPAPAPAVPDTDTRASRSGAFAEFWAAYPRKVGKGAAETAWRKHRPPLPDVLAALSWQVESEQWRERGVIPNPATWINQHRWQDEQQKRNGRPIEPESPSMQRRAELYQQALAEGLPADEARRVSGERWKHEQDSAPHR